jgi:hypothetical protein
MCQKESYPSAELICKGAKELGDERQTFFLRWLESHIGVEELNAKGQVQESTNTWLYSLSFGEAIAEHSLIMAEINWCATISIQTLRRIASAERLDNRRSRDE